MCWSGEASAVLATVGIASGYALRKRGESKLLWVPVTYFAGMEALQAFTYTVIDQCALQSNQVATILGYIHICFQPIFINMFSLYFVPKWVRERVSKFVYAISVILGFMFLLRLFPLSAFVPCTDASLHLIGFPNISFPSILCSNRLCAVSGDWHIAWDIPLYFHPFLENLYLIGAFIVPLFYGAWRITLYLFLAGPVLAALTTTNPNEWPAVWCLFSTIIMGTALFSKWREKLRVKSWYGSNFG